MPSYTRLLSLTALTGIAAILSTSPAKAQIALFKDSSNTWLQGITVQGEAEGGIMANPARPDNGINFGNFLSDHANQVQLNQLYLTLSKAVDSTKAENQFGFTLQALYGSDARYYHLLGVSDKVTSNRYQILPIQAHADAHLNVLTSGGLDIQAGILEAPMGVEVIEPTARPFYTFAYTAQYSVPFEHLGAMFHLHVNPHFDFNFGVDTGNQTTFGKNDNNNAAAGYFGFNLNGLVGGKLNIVELSRIGPEDAVASIGRRANTAQRYWNDIAAYYTVNDKLSLTGEFNFFHDVGLRAENYSFVTYASYKVTPHWTLNYRGEIFRDNSGLSVVSFLTNQAYMNAFLGGNAPAETAPPTTYGGLTLGATYSPNIGHGIRVFALRPEIRFDRSLNGTSPFNNNRNIGMFTFGGDATIGF
ncbi:outer membrane beta-barrel protein [Neokomagataea anthophila]|uniref:Outer membrane beta-barrel protein n=1 Tax=Neokomagataea anthophila TaxID=2826925 RepID=A0ABS5E913_9PROT|nr:outer membrane beta-barrel protein [Neokomagataea anthophila]MBR0560397.1 outer membrane beta-barrel protein [Neokomagataea anthophila]